MLHLQKTHASSEHILTNLTAHVQRCAALQSEKTQPNKEMLHVTQMTTEAVSRGC